MPVVQIHILDKHSLAEKRRMVVAVTNALVDTLKVPAEWVNIVITEMNTTQSAVGGALVKDIEQKTKQKQRKRKRVSQPL
jgi:4-oxalocrotonate tautomerase family enzyme